ncbi:MAG: patatin-like phospholipase family protein [Candidatus Alcyoniella australis]|nr:patatin-like phospholipase family protein [Candidatus Alcyoniella australis]
MTQRFRGLALALGGGAARGLAHLGVLRILQEEGIKVDMIVGTSAGSVVGAAFSLTPQVDKVLQKFRSFFASSEFRNARIHNMRRGGELDDEDGFWDSIGFYLKRGLAYTRSVTDRSILSWEDLSAYLAGIIDPQATFEDCRIPFCAVATDLRNGSEALLEQGSVFYSVAASSSIPGFFPPVTLDGRELIDGGTTSMVPVSAARRLGASRVIAVDVSADLSTVAPTKRSLEVIYRANEIAKYALRNQELDRADLVLRPEVGGIHWADFGRIEDYIEAGEREALLHLAQVRKLRRRSRLLLPFKGRIRGRGVPPTPV